MNIAWQLTPSERLKEWRSFRKTIEDEKTKTELYQQVVNWWKFAPIGSIGIDPYDHTDWPDPWELVYDANFDENTIALGMAYTLQLLNHDCDVAVIQNEKGQVIITVIVDEKYILNYNYGTVENFKDINCEILSRYATRDLM